MELIKPPEIAYAYLAAFVRDIYIYFLFFVFFVYQMRNHIFFSGRNIRKKCIVSRKSWYSMLDLAQNPVFSVFFPDIFNFDFSLNHSYLDLK